VCVERECMCVCVWTIHLYAGPFPLDNIRYVCVFVRVCVWRGGLGVWVCTCVYVCLCVCEHSPAEK